MWKIFSNFVAFSEYPNFKLKNVMQRSNTGGSKAKKSNTKAAAFKEKDQGFMK